MTGEALIHVVDLAGTAGFAVSGALRAMRKRPDFVGMLILATATAMGGGTLRDILLRRELAVLSDWGFPLVVLLSTALVFLWPASVARRERWVRYFDAIGLGVFSAITAGVAWDRGINPLSILFLATLTGCAGGVIRDLIIGEETLVMTNELYLTPMILGAAALMAVRATGGGAMAGFVAAMGVTVVVRVLAIWFDWRMPRVEWNANQMQKAE
jgi:uncharacterized membrane protein YeiH